MNNLINILSLDLDCNKSMPMINSSQFDKGRILVVSIAYKGEPFCVTGCEATLKCVHSNGTYTSLDCTDGIGEDGTTVTITFSDDTLPVQGVSSAKIVFTDGTRNYSTQIFLIDVDSCLEGNIKQSEPYSVLNRLIDQIIAIKNKLEKYVEVSDTSDTAVDNCTDPDTAYIVRVVSGVVSTARMRVVCSPNVSVK